MKFQVIKNGKVMFWTENEKCVPDEETIKNLKENGYKIKRSNQEKVDRI